MIPGRFKRAGTGGCVLNVIFYVQFNGANHVPSPHPRQPLDDQDPNSQDSGYCPSDDLKIGFRYIFVSESM